MVLLAFAKVPQAGQGASYRGPGRHLPKSPLRLLMKTPALNHNSNTNHLANAHLASQTEQKAQSQAGRSNFTISDVL